MTTSSSDAAAESIEAAKTIDKNTPAWTAKQNIFLGIGMLVFAAIEWHLFRQCFMRHVAPFFPNGWDQLSVYARIYQLQFSFQKIGLGIFFQDNSWLTDKASMKGFVSQLLGLVLTGTFGVNRLAAASVNFVWLIVAELVVLVTLLKRYGLPTVLLSIGLFLSACMHYITAGGIYDLRLDYAGMTIFGITTMVLWNYLEHGGRSRFYAAVACLFIAVFTRSILIFYLVGALVSLFALCSIFKFLKPTQTVWKPLFNRSLSILCAAFVALGAFLSIFWKPFYKYYLERALNGETAQWAEHYGVHSKWDTIAFNIQSFIHLFGWMFAAFAAVLGIGYLLGLASRPSSELTKPKLPLSLFLLTGCVSLSTLFCICAWMPSPNSAGVLTLPYAITLAVCAATIFDTKSKKFILPTVAAFLLGIGIFAWQMLHPPTDLAPSRAISNVISEVNRRLIGHIKLRDRTRVSYPLQTEGLHFYTLEMLWYETEQKPLPENLEPAFLPVFRSTAWPELKKFIDESDFVVMPEFKTKEDYKIFDGMGQGPVCDQMPAILNELKANFPRKEIVGDDSSNFSVAIYGR